MSATNMSPLGQVSLAHLKDYSLSISVYTYGIRKYLYLCASVLHILKELVVSPVPLPGEVARDVRRTECR